MLELPTDLPADIVPLSWLLGVWEGTGVIDYEGERPMVLCVNVGGDLKAMLKTNPSEPSIGGGDVPGVG